MNVKFYNEEGEDICIDVFGAIGESWFDEGNTMQGLREQLNAAKGKSVTLNIQSLGGDAFEGLAMYDALREHRGRITANIVGATASAGTIVAMGADEVNISENSMFLIHNCWTMAMGNADEMERVADDMRKIDKKLNKIYRKKTGKTEAFVSNLMKEEKWLTAEEAKEHGFVDRISKPVKAMAREVLNAINDSTLPKITIKNDNMKQFAKINSILNVAELEATQEGCYLNEEQLEQIEKTITDAETATAELTQKLSDKDAEAEARAAKVAKEFEDQAQAIEAKNNEIAQAVATIDTLKAEIETLKAKPVAESLEAEKPKINTEGMSPRTMAYLKRRGKI